MIDTSKYGPIPVRHRRYRLAVVRTAAVVTTTTALSATTLGLTAPAEAAPGPGGAPAYSTTTIPVADSPTGIAIDEAAHTAYVTNPKHAPQGTIAPNGTVSVIDLATNQVTHTIEVGPNPSGVAVDAESRRVYVANSGTRDIIGPSIGNGVSVIDTTTRAVVATVPVEGYPGAVTVNHRTHQVYVTSTQYNERDGVAVIDPATLQVITTIPARSPHGIALDETTNTAYVTALTVGTGTSQGVVQAINLDTGQTFGTVPLGLWLGGVAVNPATHRAYVADQGSPPGAGPKAESAVHVIDTTTDTVIADVTVGDSPVGVALDPVTQTGYVSRANGSVAVIDTTSNRLAGTVDVGGTSPYLAADATTHRAYVPNGLDAGRGAVVVLERNGDTQPTTTTVGVINPAAGAGSVLFATVAPGDAGGAVTFTDGSAIIDGCASRPIVFGYALCFTSFATGGDHAITANYLGDNAHAPSSVTVPVSVAGQADPVQFFVGQVIRAAKVILALLVPAEELPLGF